MWKEKSKDLFLSLAPYYLFLEMSPCRWKTDLMGMYKLFCGHLNLAGNDKNRVIKPSHEWR